MRSIRRLPILLITALIILAGLYLYFEQTSKVRTRVHSKLNARELPEGFNGFGIDISHYQGQIDWDLFKDSLADKIGFVYFKVSEGESLIDDRWREHNEALESHGIMKGGYHFFLPDRDPKRQAEHFLHNYMPDQHDLPPVLDVEIETGSANTLIAAVKTWIQEVEDRSGRRPIIYTSFNIYNTILKKAFPEHRFWVANYSSRQDRFKDDQILIWQYSDKGVLPGIDTYVDLNYSRINYLQD